MQAPRLTSIRQRIDKRGAAMRLPNSAHESGHWRIREVIPDFHLEDVWALPAQGGAEDFQDLIDLVASSDLAHADSLPTRALWHLRDRLGAWFDLGRISAPAGGDAAAGETSLAARLPPDLRGTAADVDFGFLPFVPLFRTTVHF